MNRKNEDNKKPVREFAPTIYGLHNGIKIMTELFPKENRPTGEEHNPFCSRLEPIVEQMEKLGINRDHLTSVLYSLLIGKA